MIEEAKFYISGAAFEQRVLKHFIISKSSIKIPARN